MTTGVAVPDGRSWGNGVTARLIPQEPVYASFSERRFATSLREQLPEDAVLFANQRFTDRDGDREADLILLWPGHGIAVIEVKGGLIHLVDGQWRQPWSNPKGWKPIDPVEQALKVKYALRDYLHQHPRWSRGNPRLIHMVALPATQLDEDFHTPEAPAGWSWTAPIPRTLRIGSPRRCGWYKDNRLRRPTTTWRGSSSASPAPRSRSGSC